jgi:cell division protein FtsN
MARDYKNTPKPRRKGSSPLPPWLWLVTGLTIGLFVALLVYLEDRPPAARDKTPVEDNSAPVEGKAADKAAADGKSAARPRFDFYNLLPEMEVMIPEQDLAAEREREAKEPVIYYLQVASFRKFEEADRLRAQLAFLNVESHIERISVTGRDNDVQTWHRVRVGPFRSAREMDKVRNRLRSASMDPIILKVKS